MNISVIQNVKEIVDLPYPHVCLENALPEKIYKELCESFPESLVTSTRPYDKGICYRYQCNPALVEKKIPQIWQDFFEYHTSPEYYRACIALFEKNIIHHYGEVAYEKLLNYKPSIRNIDRSGEVVQDCQFVIHEPVDQSGTSRTPHLDNPVEIFAGLLYMKKPNDKAEGGNFTIHESKDITQVHMGHDGQSGREIDNDLHKAVFEVPYKANTFCMFLNTKNSVHSVSPRINPTERRRSINIIGEFNGNGKMWNLNHVK